MSQNEIDWDTILNRMTVSEIEKESGITDLPNFHFGDGERVNVPVKYVYAKSQTYGDRVIVYVNRKRVYIHVLLNPEDNKNTLFEIILSVSDRKAHYFLCVDVRTSISGDGKGWKRLNYIPLLEVVI